MKMRDREQFEERFSKAAAYLDQLIVAAAKDLRNGKGKDPVELKMALSGMLAQAINVESLLAVAADAVHRLAYAESSRMSMLDDIEKLQGSTDENELPYIPPNGSVMGDEDWKEEQERKKTGE